MGTEAFDRAVSRIDYKPTMRWSAEVDWCIFQKTYRVTVTVSVPDTTKWEPGRTNYPAVRISNNREFSRDLFESQSEEEWLEYIFGELMALEMHEFREWFRVDGKLHEDPHHPSERKTNG